ncbi:MAG: hypothetical protein OXR73_06770, partial [Myxococcales bacterium]|nr:hypothetical protein [Myxococcales bacterium]
MSVRATLSPCWVAALLLACGTDGADSARQEELEGMAGRDAAESAAPIRARETVEPAVSTRAREAAEPPTAMRVQAQRSADDGEGSGNRSADDGAESGADPLTVAEPAPDLTCRGERGWRAMANPPGELARFLTVNGDGSREGTARSLAIDGVLYVITRLGAPAAGFPSGIEAGYAYDPATDRWRVLVGAGQPPAALAAATTVVAELDDGLLVTSEEPAVAVAGIYRPAEDAWEVLADDSGALVTRDKRLLVRDADGGIVDARVALEGDEFGRQYHTALVGERLVAWGGETRRCDSDGDGGCLALGVGDTPAGPQPFMARAVHDDGRVLSGPTGEWKPMAQEGAPSPRFGALVGQFGDDHMLVFGGFDQGIWGPGADPSLLASVLADGALYDPVRDAWEPFVPPPGPPLLFGVPAAEGSQVLRGFGGLGKGWMLSTTVMDPAGFGQAIRSYRFDPDGQTWSIMPEAPIFGSVRARATRAGNVLYFGRFQAWLLDWDAMAYRAIHPDSSLLPEGFDPGRGGAVIDAWDGCQFFMWGFAVSTETGCDGELPPDLGCDPYVETRFHAEGLRWTLGDEGDHGPSPAS